MSVKAGGAPQGAPPAAEPKPCLAPHVRSAALGAETILLDLRRDKYLSAPTASLQRILSGPIQASDVPLENALVCDGLLERAPTSENERRWHAAGSWAPRGATPSAFAYSCLWARQIVRKRRLEAAVDIVRGRSDRRSDPRSAVERFAQWRVWYPARNVCLFDSLALSRFLICAAADFELVFGVRSNPFAAHCWVEQRGAVLNDEPDYCRSFAEIMRA